MLNLQEMKRKIFNELKRTTNLSVYNKVYKQYLEKKGKIRCAWDKYHRGENEDQKCYGWYEHNKKRHRHPSWKLTSNNPKQWMDKKVKIVKRHSLWWYDWYEYKW